MLLVEWSRFLLYQVSIQTAMSRRAWSRVSQRRRDISSCWRVEKNDSAAALSSAYPANRGWGEARFRGPDRLVGFAAGLAVFEVAEPFFLVSDSVGECFEPGAEVGDLRALRVFVGLRVAGAGWVIMSRGCRGLRSCVGW